PDDPAKDDPLDVAVWQAGEPGHPAWDSPWGPGRPGWHAECVAMALSVFGPAMDVHAGGAELRFPHHAYHAAMAEAFTGRPPAGVRPCGPGPTPGSVRPTAPRWPRRLGSWCCSTPCWPSIPPGRCG